MNVLAEVIAALWHTPRTAVGSSRSQEMKTRFPTHLLAIAGAISLLTACGGGGDAGDTGASTADVEASAAGDSGRALALAYTLPPLTAAPAGLTGNVSCANLRIGAVTVDNVEVPAGMACRLTGTNVRGSVQVAPGGILLAGGAVQVAGSVQGDQAAHVQVTGVNSRIAGNYELEGGGSATLTGVQVGGNVFVNGLTDAVSLKNTRVAGGMQFTDNLGGGEISGNRITGNLQCTGNLPAPIAANNTAASIEDQCAPGGGVTPPSPPLSGNVTCVNLTIGAIRLDSVIVPSGASCTLLGTTLNGTIEVGATSRLIAENVNVTGDLKSDGAAELRVSGTSRVGGSVQVQRGAGASLSGLSVTGDMQIDAMTGPTAASGNRITGNMQVVGNRGGVTLTSNTMGGVMQCKENLPAPTGSRNVATLKEDQCVGL
ncbi:MAG: hypothetical protein AD742_15530 [Methylibium sp. NZG]|nr:MAG: hypothetical protein AD742_15530 [Methylibium sp. NZG]